MKKIAFFNNKGGVGKTSLVYHLSWMFSDLGFRVIAADLDPQANLSGMFADESRLQELWEGENGRTIDRDIRPLFDGTGDISDEPYTEIMADGLGLLVGDMDLSKREDALSAEWPKCVDQDERAFRVTTSFSRLIDSAAKIFKADITLIDVGPNLGAINRAALIASDFVVVPLAPDLFSLQGLRNVGIILSKWRGEWETRISRKPPELNIPLPRGTMKPIGYIVMRHSVLKNRPVRAYERWIRKIPGAYANAFGLETGPDNEHLLAHLKDYRSLMPLAQESRKAMFRLKPGDGAIGAQQSAVLACRKDFRDLAKKIHAACGTPTPD